MISVAEIPCPAAIEEGIVQRTLGKVPTYRPAAPTARPGAPHATDLEVLLQAAQQLPVDFPRLCVAESFAFGFAEAVLQDPAVFVGPLQLVAHFLQLTGILLEESIPHLVHLCSQLMDLVLR